MEGLTNAISQRITRNGQTSSDLNGLILRRCWSGLVLLSKTLRAISTKMRSTQIGATEIARDLPSNTPQPIVQKRLPKSASKLYQDCTKKKAFSAFWQFCKQLTTSKLQNLNCGKIVRLPPPPPIHLFHCKRFGDSSIMHNGALL